jgi:hypothetical protein
MSGHRHMPAHRWDGPQPAPKTLWQLIHQNFPQARNDGIYNPRNIAGTQTPSLHAEGRALDIGLSVTVPDEKLVGDQLFGVFVRSATLVGFQEIIWNRQIWSHAHPAVHRYHGHDPHTGHIHAGFTRTASQQTAFPDAFLTRIAEVRSGIEDLARANRFVA